MSYAFELRNISKGFHRRSILLPQKDSERIAAVKNVSMGVGRGEIAALIGESGCGKTTIANILLMLLRPDEGRVFIGGADVTGIRGYKNIAPVRRKIQAVFQSSGSSLDPGMTLERIIAEPLKNYGIPHRGEAERLMELVRLPGGWKGRRPGQLSGGQRQRVSIARAMALDPEILILDEPTSSLDVITANEIIRLLDGLRREKGTSMLFITHDISLAGRLCDTMYVMKDGEIVERLDSLDEAGIRSLYTLELVRSQLKLNNYK